MSRRILRVMCGLFEPQRKVRGGTAPNHHGHSARVQMELLVVEDCASGCIGAVTKVFSPMKIKGFADDITLCLTGSNQELVKGSGKGHQWTGTG